MIFHTKHISISNIQILELIYLAILLNNLKKGYPCYCSKSILSIQNQGLYLKIVSKYPFYCNEIPHWIKLIFHDV